MTPVKDTIYFPTGHWYAEFNIADYDSDKTYILEWIFEIIAGHVQKVKEYFKLGALITIVEGIIGYIEEECIEGEIKEEYIEGVIA